MSGSSPGWRTRVPGSKALLTAVLIAAVVISAVAADYPSRVIHTGGVSALREIVLSLFTPELSPAFLARVLEALWRTVAYAVAGMTIAVFIGVPGGLVASGVLARTRRDRFVIITISRGALAVLRSIHELLWAVIFVAAFGLSPVAGVLAIGIPYGGILGRIIAERLQDVPDEPLDALRSSGASELKVLVYGRLPMALPDLVSYGLYRFECAVRAAAVLSFVGLGGIGFRISIALADLRFDQVWTLLFALVLLIVGIDAWSAMVRKRMVA